MEFTIGRRKKKGKIVQFTIEEIEAAKAVGIERTEESRKIGLHDNLITKKQTKFQSEFHGALGEIAVCKALDLEWTGKGSCINKKNMPKKLIPADVEGLEVRTTTYSTGRLIIRKRDNDAKFVLVVLNDDHTARVVGWIEAEDAKQDKYWGDLGKYNKPCYIIEQRNLNPIETLQ